MKPKTNAQHEEKAGKPFGGSACSDFIGKTFVPTTAIRWRKPHPDEIMALVESTHGKHAPVLQQAWRCIEDGSFEWRDVELVDYPNSDYATEK